MLILFMIGYEMMEARRDRSGRGNVRQELKVADWVNIVMLSIVLILDLYVYSVCKDTLDGISFDGSFDADSEKFFDVSMMQLLLRRERELAALYLILNITMFLPTLRYLPTYGPTVVALINTIVHKTVRTFLLITTVLYYLASFGYSAAFGADVAEFGKSTGSFVALFRMSYVEEWDMLNGASGWIYTAFWLIYIILSTVFVNLFIAIISTVYPQLHEHSESEWETLITEHLERMIRKSTSDVDDDLQLVSVFSSNMLKVRKRVLKGVDGLKHWTKSFRKPWFS